MKTMSILKGIKEKMTRTMIDTFQNGLHKDSAAVDPRGEPDKTMTDYDAWMKGMGWCHSQNIGSAVGGFNYDVWAGKNPHVWIFSIDCGSGSGCYDVLVRDFSSYLELMGMLAPIATASMLEGDTLATLFAGQRRTETARGEIRKLGEKLGKSMMSMGGKCDCEACVASRAAGPEKVTPTVN